jgi:hypothetical protein
VAAGALPLLVQALQPGDGRRPDAQQAAAKVLHKVAYLLADDGRAAQLLPALRPALGPLLDILSAGSTQGWLAKSAINALMALRRRSQVLGAEAARMGLAARLQRWGTLAEGCENFIMLHEWMASTTYSGLPAADALMAAAAHYDTGYGVVEPTAREPNFVMPAEEPPAPPACAACGAASRADGRALMSCSACKGVRYCSAACQRRHWQQHKPSCSRGGGAAARCGRSP